MRTIEKRISILFLSLIMASALTLSGCNLAEQVTKTTDDVVNAVTQAIEGDVTGEVGTEYETKWFTFTVDSMETGTTYDDYTAMDGYTLLIAHITETNISGDTQPFSAFDWYVADGATSDEYYALSPMNDDMMSTSFYLEDGETVSCDVVIEYPSTLSSPALTYIEIDENGNLFTTFKIPVR